ncbi:unnamed protein product [Adineta steineri]|uniref:ADP ribosyltransferase domain-containing protein n=1 Tax=Adineta steineri TaxID=433720 RepID=A0A815IRS5_9BILA|nr:unnamed protein product [Adineta steineri]CAF1571159.1 unnamed protein product [Adineta steineri]
MNSSKSKSYNSSLQTEFKENKENITIIYFDLKLGKKSMKRINMLRKINDYVLMYTNLDECVAHIETIKKEKIIFVTSGKNVVNIMSRIENIRQIDGVLIFSGKINKYNQFKEKITGIFNNTNEMINAIRKHIKIIQEQLKTFSFYRRHQRYIRNLTNSSPDFLWFHVFKDVLIRLPHDEQAKQEMLNVSRHYYRNNSQELRRINEFERVYESKDAIKWYTKNSFVYRLINKALRTEDVEQMYTYRYFIQDLYSALSLEHQIFKEYAEIVTVYRGLRLTQTEFDELTKDEQQLISMNGYLSTSFTRTVAEMYAGEPKIVSDKLSVLLEIECDVDKLGDSVIFACITSESSFRNENEVLFDTGATFQLAATPKQNDNGVWHLKMTATDEGRSLVRKYIDDHLEFSTGTSAKIMYGVLLNNIGKYESSLSYFNKLLLSPEEEDRALIHVHIASALAMKDDKINEWKHYENAYKILIEAEPRRIEDEARLLIYMGIFCSDKNDNDQALEYLKRALHLFEQVYDNTNGEIARALLCIGRCYEHKGDYDRALEFDTRALKIHEQCANPNHLIQCHVLLAIGNTYQLQCKYNEAITQFQRALELRTRTLPKYHPEIADCLSLIGKTLGDMDNPSESVIYSMRAFYMYSKTLPETELNEKSSVLVDIGVAFSSVGADQLSIEYLYRALKMKKKCLPYNHPDFAAIFDNIALNYTNLNKHLLGLRYSLKACRLRKQIHQSRHPDMAGSLKALASNDVYRCNIDVFRFFRYSEASGSILHNTFDNL